MVSTATVVIIALLSLALGTIAGGLLWRAFGHGDEGKQALEKRLEEAERRLRDYQSEVTEHFVETSRRVNDLTRNYKDVHEYLASSAVKLTTPSLGRELRAAAQISRSDEEAPEDHPAASKHTAEDEHDVAANHTATMDDAAQPEGGSDKR